MVKDRPRVCQLRQSGQMLEALDRGRGGILRKTRGIEAARAVDFPEGTPKAFRGLITRVRSCAALKILNLAPRVRFISGDHLGDREGAIPGNATLFESLFHSRGECDQPTELSWHRQVGREQAWYEPGWSGKRAG